MNKNYYIKIFSILSLLALVIFSSCEEDEDVDSGQVQLLSFGPTGIQHGEEIVFIGENLNKVTSIVFEPGVEVPASSFTSSSGEQITLIVPSEVESGKVMLITPEGEIESKSAFSLEVPVEITGFTAEAKPGTNITISATNANWIDSVMFTSNLVVEKMDFVSVSATEIEVTVPMEAQTGVLTIYTGGTEPLEITTEDPLTVTLPNVTSLNPDAIRHESDLTLVGTDLDLVTQIDFTGGGSVMAADFVSQSETEIVVTVPATTKDGVITLTAPSGLTVESGELSIILPTVTAFDPSSTVDHDPGVTLTMTGTDLDLIGSLTFPNVNTPVTSFVSQSETEVQVVIPDDVSGGTIVITTIHGYTLPIELPFGDQLELATTIFDDAIQHPLGAGGGWGGVVTDASNTENPRVGSVSIKVTFAGSWGGGAQFGNWGSGETISTAGASYYAFSIYGGAGTDGQAINVNVSGNVVGVTITEGEWTDVTIPLADLGNLAEIGEIWFQDQGWSGVVYIDHIGLK